MVSTRVARGKAVVKKVYSEEINPDQSDHY